ncbi:MAG: hypothetical protein U9N31_05045 [Candidatus Marinimicrobia bacterium]|nr:hypothetical protein [Candidatus Neomarinimicrobiota bacterium]
MNLNTLFKINTVVAGLFGLGFVIAPAAVLAPYGIAQETIDASVMMARWFGASNIGFAVLFWFLSNAPDSAVKTTVAKAMCIGFAVGCLVSIQNQMTGEINVMGWSTVVLYALFSAGYGKFGFGK